MPPRLPAHTPPRLPVHTRRLLATRLRPAPRPRPATPQPPRRGGMPTSGTASRLQRTGCRCARRLLSRRQRHSLLRVTSCAAFRCIAPLLAAWRPHLRPRLIALPVAIACGRCLVERTKLPHLICLASSCCTLLSAQSPLFEHLVRFVLFAIAHMLQGTPVSQTVTSRKFGGWVGASAAPVAMHSKFACWNGGLLAQRSAGLQGGSLGSPVLPALCHAAQRQLISCRWALCTCRWVGIRHMCAWR